MRERLGAGGLSRYLDDGVVVLHDRHVPRGPTRIDHLAVGRSGVWVIDVGPHRLDTGRRDRSVRGERLAGQVALVEAVIADIAPDTPVHGAVLSYARRLARRINAGGPVSAGGVRALAAELARRFPAV